VTTPARRIRIGVDIGGTFTDLQILDEASGALYSLKTPTTPDDPSIGLMTGIAAAARRFGFRLDEIGFLLHGTTIATNAVLERKLPRGALIATAGFEDVIEIGRHNRRDVYGLRPSPPPVLIPRDRRLGIAERIAATGAVELAPDDAAIAALVARLAALEAETVAIALINAFVNPAHEHRLRDAIAAALPGLPVAISSEISPEIREYERSSTTVLNALLMPVVRSYLRRLDDRMRRAEFSPRLLLVQSNGGVCSAEIAGEQPVRLLLSGPSGGALAALRTAETLALQALVGIDMGGTSFDVSVVQGGRLTLITQGEVDRLPVRLPMVEIRTIGAGGGSIAAVDAGGRLTVGPRSAGAMPGPVCYGHGGDEPTVTDANLVLGRLDPDYFLGGAMALDLAAARAAIAARIAAPLGLAIEAAAAGVLTVTNTNLAAAIRLSLFEKGLDPREFALLSFGGAGGLHAIAVAEELGIGRVVFPRDAGTFSAYGILHSDIVHDFAQSRILPAGPESLPEVAAICAALREQGIRQCERDGIAAGDRVGALAVDMRYRGQAFELLVPWGDVAVDAASLADLVARFHALHEQRFSYANPGDAVEIVTLRLTVTGRLAQPRGHAAAAPTKTRIAQHRAAFLDGAWRDVPVHHRDALAATISGPALIEEPYTTVLLGEGWSATVESGGNLVARRVAAT
jgi:N-methylhydantoinase A